MSARKDVWLPHYMDGLAVGASSTVAGQLLLLEGASGISFQCICTNGAAGTLFIDATNQDGSTATSFVSTSGQAVTANGSAFLTYSLSDQLTSFAQVRARFVSSAAGNVQVLTNIRRPSA